MSPISSGRKANSKTPHEIGLTLPKEASMTTKLRLWCSSCGKTTRHTLSTVVHSNGGKQTEYYECGRCGHECNYTVT